ncbi:MAG TPA: serine/threonine-protein kinase [Verrucomicrobiales bacterium]|nr:serine/threonine-protein kinase [Verrucomicrobiales bacterium]
MKSPSHQREEALYEQAMQRASSEERDAFLIDACGDDDALLQKMRELLAAGAVAAEQQFLSTGLSSDEPGRTVTGGPAREAERPGAVIGRYKLLQSIGEGGFGSVWMAEQSEPIKRRVALKIIRPGMDTREVIARFEAERQALAMMDHPNIAKVFDAGATEGGRPFFVMELVKGMPVTAFCDEAKLSTRERLELFADVCSAINHAHQKGIIHRDIKPSNVLVTLHADKAVAKVIDFGIARATQQTLTDKTLFTRHGEFIGTPAYMSPEQMAFSGIDVDTRSDIYSLGVLLYELLTGKPPFDAKTLVSAGYEEMRRIIREDDPPRPSTRISTATGVERISLAAARQTDPAKLCRTVRGDLDWIVMKALEKDRTRRYETASAFAADIQRFLHDEAVLASPPSAGYRFRKFARRHKTALGVATVIAVVLVAATGVSVWQAKLAVEARNEATARAASEHAAREESEAITKFLTGVFQSPDPARDGLTITVAEKLEKAVKNLDLDLTTEPACRAQMQAVLGKTYRALGLPLKAIPLQEKVRDYYRAASGPEHSDTLHAIGSLALSLRDAGRRDEALKVFQELLPLIRRIKGPEHSDTLDVMQMLALSLRDTKRYEEALKLREEVLTLTRKVLGTEHPNTLTAMHSLAISLSDTGRRDEAFKLREEVLALRKKVNGTEHPDTLRAMGNLALSYRDTGRHEEEIRLFEEVLTLSKKVNGPKHPDTLKAMSVLATSWDQNNRRNEALKLREEVLTLRREVLGSKHPDTLLTVADLANSYEAAGRKDEALKLRSELPAQEKPPAGNEGK